MKRTLLGLFALIIISISFTQCSDSPSSGVEDDIPESDPSPEVNQACENLNLQSSSGKPTNFITIDEFSQEFGDGTYAWMVDSNNTDEKTPIAIYPDFANESAVFAIPLHPVEQMDGGDVEIEIVQENGDFTCPGIPFTVEALTPSPGASDELLESYKNGIEEIISRLGYSPDELNDKTIENVEPELIPILMAYHSIDSGVFENDLASFIDGTAPALNGEQITTEQRELIDAIISESDIVTYINDFFQSYASNIEPGLKNTNPRLGMRAFKRNTYKVYSPEYVSSLMKIQKDAEEDVTGFKGAAIQAAALTTGLVSLVGALAAVGTAGGTAPVAVASGYASMAISAAYFVTKGISDLLPSELLFLDLLATKASFEEDYHDVAGWDNVMVVQGRKFSVSASDIISFLPTGKIFELKKVTGAIGEINAKLLEIMASLNTSVASIYDDSGVLEIEKLQWGVILDPERENEEKYFSWEIDYLSSPDGEPPVFGLCTDCTENTNLGYYPLKEGVSELRVEAMAEPFNFPANPVKTQEITVYPISIDVAPQSTSLTLEEVKAGETVEFRADVYDALDKQLEWSADDGFFTYDDDLAHNVTYHPPEKLGSYTVTAEAITETGPREGREPPRTETANVYIEDEEASCFNGDLSDENVYEFTLEASGSYEYLENGGEFAITYSFVEPREDEDGCTESGVVYSDEINLPWSTSKIVTAPAATSINMVGLQDHSNNVTLSILLDGEEVASYTHQGVLDEEAVVPENDKGAGLVYTVE
jgi:hypothetical protein